MLKKPIDYKLILLRICLYLIIFIISSVGVNKVYKTYQSISNITAEDLSKWLSKNNYNNVFIKIGKIKLDWRSTNLYFNLEEVSLRLSDYNASLIAQEINGKINILSAILYGKIKINNFVAKDLILIVNNADVEKTIIDVNGSLEINTSVSKNITTLNISSYLTKVSIGDAINFNINAVVNINSLVKNVFVTKFRLQNTADNIREVIKYLPDYAVNPTLLKWLNQSMLSGSITHNDLYWDQGGVFTWKVKFKDIKLQYAENWPPLLHLYATMDIIDDNLTIELDPGDQKGFILQQPIKKLSAKLNNITADHVEPLLVEAEITAQVNKGVEFLRQSDLRYLGKHLAASSPYGNMDLYLKLLIPMSDDDNYSEPIKFSGNCKLTKANLKITDLNLDLLNVSGDIKFSNNYFTSDNIQANIFNTDMYTKFVLEDNYLFMESPALFKTKILLNKRNKIINEHFDVTMEELFLFDNAVGKVRIIKDPLSNKLSFEGANAKGSLFINDLKSADYSIDFHELKLITDNKDDNKNFNNINLLSKINKMNFNCKNFYLNNINFGEINSTFIKDQNLQDNNLIYHNILEFKLKEINLNANGDWLIDKSKKSTTNINAELHTKNLGNVLKKFNPTNQLIQKGNGVINFKLQWPHYPFGFSLNNITGTVNLDIKEGVVTGVEPGLGRAIGLLSIENIQRRLHLDFSDVTNSGFSFDQLIGNLNLNQGEVTVDHVIIQGPSAKMIITGNVFLITKNLDLLIEVNSKIGATLPLAAAIAAGNPAIGAAIWLFDRATGAKVSEIKVQKYKVTGTWDNPKITEWE